MSIRRQVLLVAALIAGAMLSPGPLLASASGAAQRCERKPGETLLRTSQVRVFRSDSVTRPAYYGCRVSRTRATRLGDARVASLDPIRVKGNLIAYQLRSVRKEAISFTLTVKSLATGRTVTRWAEDSAEPGGRYFGVTDVALTRSGAVGWMVTRQISEIDRRTLSEVRKTDADGRAIVLDAGPGVDPESLAATASTLYWTNDGRDSSAPLR